jgi:hypothetical protein
MTSTVILDTIPLSIRAKYFIMIKGWKGTRNCQNCTKAKMVIADVRSVKTRIHYHRDPTAVITIFALVQFYSTFKVPC